MNDIVKAGSIGTHKALMRARRHADETTHYVVANIDGVRWVVTWECQQCGERGES